MQVALAEHPEWDGDWEAPAGLEQVEVNPKTGAPTQPEDTEKRVEYFINGTGPDDTTETPTEEASPEELPDPTPGIEPQPMDPIQAPSPSPSPRRPAVISDGGGRLEGTITLDIDPTTGLIAVESCPIIRTKTFTLGTEPRKYCGPEYHRGKTIEPVAPGRPRVVGTPQR